MYLYSTGMSNGYPTFTISILFIGIVTTIIGDAASHFGSSLGIPDSLTAIMFVALGTSIPGIYLLMKIPNITIFTVKAV